MASKDSRGKSPLQIDYRNGQFPAWVREVIETQLAIDSEDARAAGSLGFMARALVLATMPYKDPKTDAFTRVNGDFRLRIVAGYDGGIPYGVYPRVLMSWLTSQAVREQSPVIELGDSLAAFLREVMGVRSRSGGERGSATRVTEQMKRLFGSLITASHAGTEDRAGFVMRNVLIADGFELSDADARRLDGALDSKDQAPETGALWTPQAEHEAGQWRSHVRLTPQFFQELVTNPVPIDLRAFKALRGSPMAMDVYTWLTYRMSYTHRTTAPIRWESLMGQVGSGYNLSDDTGQAVRNFKKAFIAALERVRAVYPQARFTVTDTGLVLHPSPTHVKRLGSAPSPKQGDLFGIGGPEKKGPASRE